MTAELTIKSTRVVSEISLPMPLVSEESLGDGLRVKSCPRLVSALGRRGRSGGLTTREREDLSPITPGEEEEDGSLE